MHFKLTLSFSKPEDSSASPICGQIIDIIQNSLDDAVKYVILDEFKLGSERHLDFGMPVLTRRLEETSIFVLEANVSERNLCNYKLYN